MHCSTDVITCKVATTPVLPILQNSPNSATMWFAVVLQTKPFWYKVKLWQLLTRLLSFCYLVVNETLFWANLNRCSGLAWHYEDLGIFTGVAKGYLLHFWIWTLDWGSKGGTEMITPSYSVWNVFGHFSCAYMGSMIMPGFVLQEPHPGCLVIENGWINP